MQHRWLLQLLFVTARVFAAREDQQPQRHLMPTPAAEEGAATAGRLYIEEYTALDKFEHRSDCFRRVSTESLRGRCDRLEMDESARVRVALSLAICELKAASSRDELVPMECAAFASEDRESAAHHTDPRAYTQAMLRSTQAWASFSGYHRDILPICAALRHNNGIDRALEIFHNATLGNVALIRYFEKRTAEDEISREGWRDLHGKFLQTSSDLRMLQSRFNEASIEIVTEASELLHTAFASGETIVADMQTRWESTQRDSLDTYQKNFERIQDAFAGQVTMRSHDLAAALDHVSMRFSLLHNGLETQLQSTKAINQDLNAISTTMQTLQHASSDLSSDLSESVLVSTSLRMEQEGALRETIQLAQAVQHLTYTVDDATKNFEEAIIDVIEKLPATLAHGVVSLGHRTMLSWFAELSWLSLTGIAQYFVRLAWDYPIEAVVVYLLVYRCIPRAIAFAWWFVAPVLGPVHLILRLLSYLRCWLSPSSSEKTSLHSIASPPMPEKVSSLPTYHSRRRAAHSESPPFTPSFRNQLPPLLPARSTWVSPPLQLKTPFVVPLRKVRAQSAPVDLGRAPVDLGRAARTGTQHLYAPVSRDRDIHYSSTATPRLEFISEHEDS